ncbi:MAG: antirestriction protein ArdA [Holophagaceae bacterium]
MATEVLNAVHFRPSVFVSRITDCLDGFWLRLDIYTTVESIRKEVEFHLGVDTEWGVWEWENIPDDMANEISGSFYQLAEISNFWLHSSNDIEWEAFVKWCNSTYKSKLWGNFHGDLTGVAESGSDFAYDLYEHETKELPELVRLNIDWQGVWETIQAEYEVIEVANGEKYFFAY